VSRGGKRQTSFDSERAREAARKSAEVRRRKREQRQETPVDHRSRLVAQAERELDKAEKTGTISNMAAFVALQRLALDQMPATRDPRSWESHAEVQRASEEFTRKVQEIAARRREQAPGLVEEIQQAITEGADGGVLDEETAAGVLEGLYEAGLIRPGRVMDGDPVGVVAELRRALADQPGRVAHKFGTTLDDMLTTLAEVGGVSPARFRALADVAEQAQAKRLEKATKAPEPKVEPEQAVTNGADVARPPFVDPAFAHALEERRSLGLGPVEWD
jgi:hypothetical protein